MNEVAWTWVRLDGKVYHNVDEGRRPSDPAPHWTTQSTLVRFLQERDIHCEGWTIAAFIPNRGDR